MGAAGMNVNAVGIVVFWYTVTLVFNWTAFNLVVLKDDPALALLPADITLIEMFACTICGALTLYNKGLGFIPPPGLRIRMLVLALANAAACQLFMFAMDFVALSLIQTIRACQPILTVFVGEFRSHGRHACRGDAPSLTRPANVGTFVCRADAVYFCFGEKYNAVTYATLIPICLGFALAAGGDPKFEQTGFLLAVVSACCLVAVNTISRHTLAFYRSLVGPLQVQAWATSGSFFLLLVPWLFTGVCRSTHLQQQECQLACRLNCSKQTGCWLLVFLQAGLHGWCSRCKASSGQSPSALSPQSFWVWWRRTGLLITRLTSGRSRASILSTR